MRNRIPPLSFLLGVVLLAPAAPGAELTWERTTFEATVDPDQKEIRTAFGFRNRSDTPITIIAVTTDCECTTASLEKKTYSPGEAGAIHVKFALGERVGVVEKKIQVETDQKSPATRLLLRTIIRTYVAVATRTVWWQIGGKTDAKTIRFTAGALNNLSLLEIKPSDGFAVRSETIEAGRTFDLVITPASTAAAASGKVDVAFEVIGVGRRTFSVYAFVK
jgi:hypothetical protein